MFSGDHQETVVVIEEILEPSPDSSPLPTPWPQPPSSTSPPNREFLSGSTDDINYPFLPGKNTSPSTSRLTTTSGTRIVTAVTTTNSGASEEPATLSEERGDVEVVTSLPASEEVTSLPATQEASTAAPDQPDSVPIGTMGSPTPTPKSNDTTCNGTAITFGPTDSATSADGVVTVEAAGDPTALTEAMTEKTTDRVTDEMLEVYSSTTPTGTEKLSKFQQTHKPKNLLKRKSPFLTNVTNYRC